MTTSIKQEPVEDTDLESRCPFSGLSVVIFQKYWKMSLDFAYDASWGKGTTIHYSYHTRHLPDTIRYPVDVP